MLYLLFDFAFAAFFFQKLLSLSLYFKLLNFLFTFSNTARLASQSSKVCFSCVCDYYTNCAVNPHSFRAFFTLVEVQGYCGWRLLLLLLLPLLLAAFDDDFDTCFFCNCFWVYYYYHNNLHKVLGIFESVGVEWA